MLESGRARPRRRRRGDTGEQGQLRGHPICSPNHPISSSHPKPGKVDLFWVRESHKILSREHRRAAKHPRDHRIGGCPPTVVPPPWPCRGATCTSPCHIPHLENPKSLLLRGYSAFTPAVLALSRAGEGWFGVVPLCCSAPACPALSFIKFPRQSRRDLNNHSGKPN